MNIHRSECGPYPMVDLLNRIERNQKLVSRDCLTNKKTFESNFSYREIIPTQYINDENGDKKWQEDVLNPTKAFFFVGERKLVYYVLDKKCKRLTLVWEDRFNLKKKAKNGHESLSTSRKIEN